MKRAVKFSRTLPALGVAWLLLAYVWHLSKLLIAQRNSFSEFLTDLHGGVLILYWIGSRGHYPPSLTCGAYGTPYRSTRNLLGKSALMVVGALIYKIFMT